MQQLGNTDFGRLILALADRSIGSARLDAGAACEQAFIEGYRQT
jgi:hypothetical protein